MNIDRARELAENAMIDLLGDGPETVEPFTLDGWHDACADYVLSDSVTENNRLRDSINGALFWLECNENTPRARHDYMRHVLNIGTQVITNCLRSGLTLEMLGAKR